ncbi:MAG: UDP-N-acetylglucosamine--N-acetylmuramyl-(pentapeptide) pyrophosphoryl-undecaprenol N-acetylglucosamine transferase [bacterium]|nr:UDP-N-acetylglucosamine--N-acetylmuramyl-(pentapeptide) pyrophosphoryl-undecaprenol N-acetylglucosamine transferase [bacterium]
MNFEKNYKILFTGGGTGGSVAPLLAVAEELNNPPNPLYQGGKNKTPSSSPLSGGEYEFLWLGTKFGPEREMVASASSPRPELGTKAAQGAGIKFRAINGGKWRRYFSFKNLLDVVKIKLGFWQAFFIMLKWRPDLVISAGSFVSVPVIWAAWFLRAPILIHQQDAMPGLANKLMAPLARAVTVTFEKSLADYGKKAVWTGNPVRNQLKITNYKLRIKNFKIQDGLPVLLVLGGGTGAMAINKLVEESLSELTKFCQIIHVTGKNKNSSVILEPKAIESHGLELKQGDPIASLALRSRMTNYFAFEFLDAERIAGAFKLADVVVTRAGLGFLTELSFLSKPAIIIPLPDSHQEANAEMFKEAAIVLEQKDLNAEKFVGEIKNLIGDKELQKELGEKIGRVMKPGANEAMVKIILELLK